MTGPCVDDLPPVWGFMGYPPNSAVGGGIILRNLLGGYPREKLTFMTNQSVVDDLAGREDGGGLLDAAHEGVRPWRTGLPGLRRIVRFANHCRLIPLAFRLARRVHQGGVILAVPWGGEFGSELYVTAYLVHRLTGVPLVVYEMDEWRASLGASCGWTARALERAFHGPILRAARTVWCISPALVADFRSRFGVEARVMAHCVNVQAYSRGRRGERSHRGTFRLLYTGAIYGPQADALRNALRAIQSEPDGRFELAIYTNEGPDSLAAMGIHGPRLRVHSAVPVEAIPDLLGDADSLILPFAFADDQRAVVSTSLPTKTADYLSSGVPILVHAPPYATVTRLARAEGWAEVVDVPDPGLLTASLRRLADDAPLRRKLVERALQTAAERHDVASCRASFYESFSQAVGISPATSSALPTPGQGGRSRDEGPDLGARRT